MSNVATQFNRDTAKLAGMKSGEVRRQKALERLKVREAMNSQADQWLADFAEGKPVMGTKLSAEIRQRMVEQVIVNALIQKMNLAAKFEYETDLLTLKSDIKAEEAQADHSSDDRTGLTPTEIMNLLGTQTESISASKIITVQAEEVEDLEEGEDLEAELMQISFIEWYNEADESLVDGLIKTHFDSQSDFFEQAERPALEVIKERGIKWQL